MTRRFIVGLFTFAVLFLGYVLLSSRTGERPEPVPAVATSPLENVVARPPAPRQPLPSRGTMEAPPAAGVPAEDPALAEKRDAEEREVHKWRDQARIPAE